MGKLTNFFKIILILLFFLIITVSVSLAYEPCDDSGDCCAGKSCSNGQCVGQCDPPPAVSPPPVEPPPGGGGGGSCSKNEWGGCSGGTRSCGTSTKPECAGGGCGCYSNDCNDGASESCTGGGGGGGYDTAGTAFDETFFATKECVNNHFIGTSADGWSMDLGDNSCGVTTCSVNTRSCESGHVKSCPTGTFTVDYGANSCELFGCADKEVGRDGTTFKQCYSGTNGNFWWNTTAPGQYTAQSCATSNSRQCVNGLYSWCSRQKTWIGIKNCSTSVTPSCPATAPSLTGVTCTYNPGTKGFDIRWSAPNLAGAGIDATKFVVSRFTMASWKGSSADNPANPPHQNDAYINAYPTDNGLWSKYLCVDHGIPGASTTYPIPNANASAWSKNWPTVGASWPGRCDWALDQDLTPADKTVSYR